MNQERALCLHRPQNDPLIFTPEEKLQRKNTKSKPSIPSTNFKIVNQPSDFTTLPSGIRDAIREFHFLVSFQSVHYYCTTWQVQIYPYHFYQPNIDEGDYDQDPCGHVTNLAIECLDWLE